VEPVDDWLADEGELDWLHDPRTDDGSPPATVVRGPERGPPTAAPPPRRRPKAVERRRRAFVLGGIGVGVLVVIVIVIATSGGGSGGSPAASATTEQTPTTSPTTTTTPGRLRPPAQQATVQVTLPASGTLSTGDTGAEVLSVQKALDQLGYDVGTPDGDFGSKTEAAVISFQTAHKLTPDGIVGASTAKALNDALAANG
jgi:putative peptidoglycan binding protein